ncbi:MAG TPA: FkbM family methyltransferase [Caulifigura sp.]|jgi:FkbM family methyltransferase|nr:FkbM family methyltransferase [Caulifigura sp.]
MSLIRRLRSAVKGRYQRYIVRRHYGVENPDVIQLPGSERQIHIDPADPRAWKILAMAPLFGRIARNQTYWQQACSQLAPSLGLDIGLNFGECLFSTEYSPQTELHGFEANPRLRHFVTKSRADHPAWRQMHLHFGLVSDMPADEATFYIDKRWSGGSTAIAGLKPQDSDRFELVKVPVLTVDNALASTRASRPGGSMVFKIDVEGYEFRVLQGMRKTLEAPRWAIGLIEFDTAMLKKAGESLEEYFEFLRQRFTIHAFLKGNRATPAPATWAEFSRVFRKPEFHTDLLLTAGEPDDRVLSFLKDWTTGGTAGQRRAA